MNGERSKPSVVTTTLFKLRPHTLSMFFYLFWHGKDLACLGLPVGHKMLHLRYAHTLCEN